MQTTKDNSMIELAGILEKLKAKQKLLFIHFVVSATILTGVFISLSRQEYSSSILLSNPRVEDFSPFSSSLKNLIRLDKDQAFYQLLLLAETGAAIEGFLDKERLWNFYPNLQDQNESRNRVVDRFRKSIKISTPTLYTVSLADKIDSDKPDQRSEVKEAINLNMKKSLIKLSTSFPDKEMAPRIPENYVKFLEEQMKKSILQSIEATRKQEIERIESKVSRLSKLAKIERKNQINEYRRAKKIATELNIQKYSESNRNIHPQTSNYTDSVNEIVQFPLYRRGVNALNQEIKSMSETLPTQRMRTIDQMLFEVERWKSMTPQIEKISLFKVERSPTSAIPTSVATKTAAAIITVFSIFLSILFVLLFSKDNSELT